MKDTIGRFLDGVMNVKDLYVTNTLNLVVRESFG